MSLKVKLTAYAVLLILAVWFSWGFYSAYIVATSAPAFEAVLGPSSEGPAALPASESNTPPSTNVVLGTNTPSSGVEEATNTEAGTTNTAAISPAPTNQLAATTNSPVPKKKKRAVTRLTVQQDRAEMIRYLAALVGTLIGLGVLIAIDVSHLIGSQATNYLFNDVADAARDPAYERAEAEWANGRHLEAIQMMREFLKKNPRELYAALRIAEIYEKDLRNYLAAALEYEEVLKFKLPAERWGWSAIHLCNLYSKLGQQPKAAALLHRIVGEYPRTGAAKKARARLGLQELVDDAPAEKVEEALVEGEEAPYQIEAPAGEAPAPPPPEATPPGPPKSNLPSGFSPKK